MWNEGTLQGGMTERANRREGYLTDRRFSDKFKQLLSRRTSAPRPIAGVDRADAASQAIAAFKGNNNAPKLRDRIQQQGFVDPVTAAMQHSIRNRAVEQGANRPTQTPSSGMPAEANSSVMQKLKKKGLL